MTPSMRRKWDSRQEERLGRVRSARKVRIGILGWREAPRGLGSKMGGVKHRATWAGLARVWGVAKEKVLVMGFGGAGWLGEGMRYCAKEVVVAVCKKGFGCVRGIWSWEQQ
ncbi:unnamed protein product [Sphenostylis stenocarpa]|uniref:Uncharacterized protein n=1 Tax=Sphenostylis stenocarpa TaxID=92480 RepID=A0AA86S8X2_9FABA|nr:unnamed protein product [Sphenostylis stenocarpa]